ncbi:MAG: MtnX-like HAD-IB family phosphatase [Candidatus Zixiibacteriota bacterium]
MKTAVFCDFDGTITRRDVGYHLFRHFSGGKNEKLIPDWKAGRLSTRDCLVQEAAMVHASEDAIYRFLDQFELDKGFAPFVKLSLLQNVDIFIISDGLDFYINYILKRHKLNYLPVLANIGRLENDRIIVEFPYRNHTCHKCGSCKGERIREYKDSSPSPNRIIFVGDGYSDACALKEADFIFAKKDLEEYCLSYDITCYTYDDFHDVAQQMITLGHINSM